MSYPWNHFKILLPVLKRSFLRIAFNKSLKDISREIKLSWTWSKFADYPKFENDLCPKIIEWFYWRKIDKFQNKRRLVGRKKNLRNFLLFNHILEQKCSQKRLQKGFASLNPKFDFTSLYLAEKRSGRSWTDIHGGVFDGKGVSPSWGFTDLPPKKSIWE